MLAMRILAFGFVTMLLGACAQDARLSSTIPTGAAAYGVIPAFNAAPADLGSYRIGPLDTLDVTVFQEPELSVKAMQVDAAGLIALPLVGSVDARGKTALELSEELKSMFGAKYLKNPQVTVTVASSVSQKISIQGQVAEPGVYPVSGPTTLLEVISLAKGETDLAKLNEVVVFRNINGQRMGAVFDIGSIRRGEAADPVMQSSDLVVVGYSSARRFWQNILRATPILGVFTRVVPLP